jgi:hypothetical protein
LKTLNVLPGERQYAVYRLWAKTASAYGALIGFDSLRLAEQHIYGSNRVGMTLPALKLWPAAPSNPHTPNASFYTIPEGWKRYELSNHPD